MKLQYEIRSGNSGFFPTLKKFCHPSGTCDFWLGRAGRARDVHRFGWILSCVFMILFFSWNNCKIWKLYSHMAVLVLSIVTFSSRTIDSTDHAKTQNKRKHYACSGPSETSLDCFPIAHRFFHGRGWPEWLDDVDGFVDIGFRKNVQNWFLKIGEKSKTHVPSGWDVRQENAYWSIFA